MNVTLYYVQFGHPAETLLFISPAHEADPDLPIGTTYDHAEAQHWAEQARADGFESVEVAEVEV